MRMKKKVISLLVLTVCVWSLVGSTTLAKDKTTLKVLLSVGAPGSAKYEAYQRIIAEYKATHPNITLKFDGTASRDYDKITISLATGDTWDVIDAHQGVIMPWAAQGGILPLDQYTGPSSPFKDIVPRVLQLYRDKGHLWAIPYQSQSVYMLFNKSMFANAGLTEPENSWKLDEWFASGKKMTNPDEGKFGLGRFNRDIFTMVAAQMGARLFDDRGKVVADSPEFARALEFTYVDVPRIATSSGSAFAEGRAATTRGNMPMYRNLVDGGMEPDNLGTILFPGDTTQATYNGAPAWFIPKAAKHVKEALEFIQFFVLRSESQKAIAAASMTPVTLNGIHNYLLPVVGPQLAETESRASEIAVPWAYMYNWYLGEVGRQAAAFEKAGEGIMNSTLSPGNAAKQIADELRGMQ